MIGRPRGGAPLLAGLAAGAVLVVSAMLVAPVGTPLAGLPFLEMSLDELLPDDASPDEPSPEPQAALVPIVPTPRPFPFPLPRVLPPDLLPLPVPPPTTEPAPTTPPPEPELGATDAVIAATNAARVDAGCDELAFDGRLAAAAQGHSEDMAENGYFSHTGLDGSTFDERIRDEGHPDPGGENIARGQETAAEVVAGWMNSPGHRRNILDCDFVDIGVGFDPRGNYWTQEFGL